MIFSILVLREQSLIGPINLHLTRPVLSCQSASGRLTEGGNPYSGVWVGTKGNASANLEENPDL